MNFISFERSLAGEFNGINTFYEKMTIYKLEEVLDSHYNRSDVKRHHRSVLFFIQNTVTGNQSLYEIDRIAKHSAALTPMGKTVLSKDVNKIYFDDFAHTVH